MARGEAVGGNVEEDELRGEEELQEARKVRKQRKREVKDVKKVKHLLKKRDVRIEAEAEAEGGGGASELRAAAEEFVPPAFPEGSATTIGTSAGADSREALRDRGESAPLGAGSRRTHTKADGSGNRKFGSVMTKEDATALVKSAKEEKLGVTFDQEHRKSGMSKERYEVYKHLSTMEEIEEAERTPFTYTSGKTGTVMKPGDLKHDVERGIALIEDGAGGYLAAASMAVEAVGRRGVKGLMDSGAVEFDQEYYGTAQGWGADAPHWFAMAARARSMVVVDGMVEPISLRQATQLAEWPSWMESIEREVQGLMEQDTWEEVDRSEAIAKGARVIPSHFIFKIKMKDDGAGRLVVEKLKSRLVYGGHRSVAGRDHFETAAYTASPKSIRTMLALAARSGDSVVNYDVAQAFLFSRVEDGLEMYMELPELLGADGAAAPGEYARCGSGRGSGGGSVRGSGWGWGWVGVRVWSG